MTKARKGPSKKRASRRGKTQGSSISRKDQGCKGCVGGQVGQGQSSKKDHGRASVTAECKKISSKNDGEGSDQERTDAEARRLGEQTGCAA